MTDEWDLQPHATKARRKRARQFAGVLVLIGLASGFVLYVGINLLALAAAP